MPSPVKDGITAIWSPTGKIAGDSSLSAKIAVGDGGDRNRLVPAGLGAIEKIGEKWRLLRKVGRLGSPVGADALEQRAMHNPA